MCVTGMISMWSGTDENVPEGWLVCDGSALSQSNYAALYAAIGTNFGANPPTGQFYIPDLRGRFVRGQDPNGTLDPDSANRTDMQDTNTVVGATVGSVQADAFQNHVHPYTIFPAGSGAIASGNYWAQGPANTGTVDPSSYRTSSETRPVNAYLIYIIKD
jgi:microcystin-dependent protein